MNSSTLLNSFIQVFVAAVMDITLFSISQLRGYSITEAALAAIESNVNGIVSKICSPGDSATGLDTQHQTPLSLPSGYKRVDSTKSSTERRKRVRESSSKGSNVSAPKKSKNAVSDPDPADKKQILAAIVAANSVHGDRSLATATLCGVTMQQDKWVSCHFFMSAMSSR